MTDFEEWNEFVKNKLPEFDIQKGSTFEANLYLAFNEMRDIFTQKEYCLEYKIKELKKETTQLKSELSKAREVIEFYADRANWYGDEQEPQDIIILSDLESSHRVSYETAGKRAREYLERNK